MTGIKKLKGDKVSISDLLKILKSRNVNIATLTRQQVVDAGYDGPDGISLVISDVKRAHHYQQNPPKRRKRTRRPRKTDTGRQTRRSFHAKQVLSRGRATLELVERVNGGDTETEINDNPLRLFNTAPDELYPRFVIIRPEAPDSVLDDLADALPDTGYRMTDYEERQP